MRRLAGLAFSAALVLCAARAAAWAQPKRHACCHKSAEGAALSECCPSAAAASPARPETPAATSGSAIAAPRVLIAQDAAAVPLSQFQSSPFLPQAPSRAPPLG